MTPNNLKMTSEGTQLRSAEVKILVHAIIRYVMISHSRTYMGHIIHMYELYINDIYMTSNEYDVLLISNRLAVT